MSDCALTPRHHDDDTLRSDHTLRSRWTASASAAARSDPHELFFGSAGYSLLLDAQTPEGRLRHR
jgi:hypothetical protein